MMNQYEKRSYEIAVAVADARLSVLIGKNNQWICCHCDGTGLNTKKPPCGKCDGTGEICYSSTSYGPCYDCTGPRMEKINIIWEQFRVIVCSDCKGRGLIPEQLIEDIIDDEANDEAA